MRRYAVVVGALVLLIGVIALLVPVSTTDGNGGSISCGNAIASDMSAAREANSKSVADIPILNQIVPHNDYVAQCESEVSQRRTWSIPLAAVGLLVTAGAFVGGRKPVGSGV